MDNFEFYKQFYLKELTTKTELNNAVNLPILIISTLISLNIFIIQKLTGKPFELVFLVSMANFLTITISIVYITKSFSNFWNKHTYVEINDMNEYYEYESKLKEKKQEDEFKPYLEKRFANCAAENFKLNKKRTEDLATGKEFLAYSLALTFITSMIFLISLIINK